MISIQIQFHIAVKCLKYGLKSAELSEIALRWVRSIHARKTI